MGKIIGRILRILAWLAPFYQFRVSVHRRCGVKIGKGVFIGPNVMFDSQHPEYIEIQDWVAIGPGAIIVAHGGASALHQKLKVFDQPPKKITIEKGAWIAAGAIILPGVTVGQGAIVAAGAVVSRDVPPMTLVVGNPARAVQKLSRESD
jgi:acetyltransferase-like isoleucine patch superfamily enzyme